MACHRALDSALCACYPTKGFVLGHFGTAAFICSYFAVKLNKNQQTSKLGSGLQFNKVGLLFPNIFVYDLAFVGLCGNA